MADLEAVGDIVTGGAVARAVEPDDGGASATDGHDGICRNCGCTLVGDFCHCCGQRGHVHRTIGAWWHDFLHSVLHLDGKFWRTLPMLALRPGELTRRYAHGERAKFISPLALFLFSVFVMFAAMSLLGSPTELATTDSPGEARAEAEMELRAERAEANEALARLSAELAEARRAGQSTQSIQQEIVGVRRSYALQEQAYRLAIRLANEAEAREESQAQAQAQREARNGRPQIKVGPEALREARGEPEFNLLTETGWAPLDKAIAKAEGNPSLLFYKIQANAYKFSWTLIPISLPFLWALFFHRRRYRQEFGGYDHIVFITYSIAFMSLGAILLTVLDAIGVPGAITGLAMVLVPPVHIYRQLRGAYLLSKWSAIWRTVALLLSSFIALGMFLGLLVVVGVFG